MLECIAVILISIALIAIVFGTTFEEDWSAKCNAFWDHSATAESPTAPWQRDAPGAAVPGWDWRRATLPRYRGAADPPDWEWISAEPPDCGWPPEDREATTASALLHYLA